MDLSENCYWHSSIATMKTCSQNTVIEQLKLQDEKLFDGKKLLLHRLQPGKMSWNKYIL